MKTIFDRIESQEFAVRFGVFSSINSFTRAIKRSNEFDELLNSMNDTQGFKIVLQRSLELCSKEIDHEFANPWDTALATYLVAMDNAGCMFNDEDSGMLHYHSIFSLTQGLFLTPNLFRSAQIADSLMTKHKRLATVVHRSSSQDMTSLISQNTAPTTGGVRTTGTQEDEFYDAA